jgi:hypothetical protein
MADKPSNNPLAILEGQLAQRTQALRSQITSPSATRLSIDTQANFVGVDGLILGPEIEFIVLDFITAHRYYPRPYNPNNPEPPVCFAFGRDLNDMVPDETSPEMQNNQCGIPGREGCCPMNEWKSDARGVGKACKNTREVAVITHDQFELPPEEQRILVYSVPPTGIKSFDAAVGYMLRTYNTMPSRNVFRATAVKAGTYTTVNFQPTDEVNPFLEEHIPRIAECEELLYRLPDVSNYKPAKQPAPRPARAR